MITIFHPLKCWFGEGEDIQTSGCAVQLTLFFGHPQATHQLLQGERLVVADVAVLHKLLHALLWLGFLAQEAFERLDLLLAYVPAGVFVQLTEIPMDHPFLQGVAGVGLGHPKWQIPVQLIVTPTSRHPKEYFHAFLSNDWILSSIIIRWANPLLNVIPSGGCWICDSVHHVCRQRIKNACQELCFLCPRTAWKIKHRHLNERVQAYSSYGSKFTHTCQQSQKNYLTVNSATTMWNAAIIGGLINVWGGTSCNSSVVLTYSKDGGGENKPKQHSCSCLFLPLIKCQTSPHLEEEEGTCQSSWRPLSGFDS